MFLDKKSFLYIINKTPLCSIDILVNFKNKYLFGLRENKPALGYYFVPGGRILKNEDYNKTILRILDKELGLKIKRIKFSIIGIYNHFYKNNVYGVKKTNTHIFVCAIKIVLRGNITFKNDNQHSKFLLLTKKQALAHKKIHRYCKIYLRREK